ncbi:MAG: divergent polysaccharide deacetylase family protein [Acidobacteriota bacterium]
MAAKKKSRGARRKQGHGLQVLLGLVLALLGLTWALRTLRQGPPADDDPTPPAVVERTETRETPRTQPPRTDPPRTTPKPTPPRTSPDPPRTEPKPPVTPPRRTTPTPRPDPPRPRGDRPRVAIVLDDCGFDLGLMKRAARIGLPMTMAVLPERRHSIESARIAHRAGLEVILHQPMEPESRTGSDPGEGALVVGMPGGNVASVLRRNLLSVPHVAGLNNHMGSRATADPALMEAFSTALVDIEREDLPGLYFLDSRTTAATVAYDTARRHGLPVAMRTVFLDNEESVDHVRQRLDELLARAHEQEEVIGIGHLKSVTLTALEALARTQPAVEFVSASQLAR